MGRQQHDDVGYARRCLRRVVNKIRAKRAQEGDILTKQEVIDLAEKIQQKTPANLIRRAAFNSEKFKLLEEKLAEAGEGA